MNKYYVYIHRKIFDNKPFYVGKGSGNRAWGVKGKSRNDYWKRVAKKYGFIVEIVFSELSEEEAFDLEINTILEFKYLGYELTNLSNGGEGNSGLVFSDKQRLNISTGLKKKTKEKLLVKRPKSYGDNNHFADKNKYCFVRLEDGFEITCSRHELSERFNVDKRLLKKLFYSNPRKSADGWKLKESK